MLCCGGRSKDRMFTDVGMPPEPDPENPPPDVLVHKPFLDPENLPKSVSWRYTGQDAVVKDQATCGSCYVRPRSLLLRVSNS